MQGKRSNGKNVLDFDMLGIFFVCVDALGLI